MKKIFFILLIAALCCGNVFAELTVSGEAKTGILQTTTEDRLNGEKTRTNAGSKDDAGSGAGRFRMNVDYLNDNTNLGFKFRVNWEQWGEDAPAWSYAFGYGNFFSDQLTVSLGKLGASPWGTGGPDLWKELESFGTTGGIRFEYKPSFVEGLNVGFVINGFNRDLDMYPDDEPITILHMLQESVVGVSYTHEYFHARAAFRFDSEVDQTRGTASGNDGGELVYRLEEYILQKYVPGLRMWALGYFNGIGIDEENIDEFGTNNWFFTEYSNDLLLAQFRVGLDVIAERTLFHLRPALFFKFFGNLLNVGAQFVYAQDYGEGELGKLHPGSPFSYIEIEPKIQLNFAPGAYAALVYNWRQEYARATDVHKDPLGNVIIDPIKQTQWINFRVGIYF